ncbi:hypothetical protein [Brevibacillus sp. SYSU BS000544]|uniref:hypothetical protein n=1 Tax=Brevibacillus sp. SYSU BS000544 TaxID=3416443 RepID=UPI003CE4ED76
MSFTSNNSLQKKILLLLISCLLFLPFYTGSNETINADTTTKYTSQNTGVFHLSTVRLKSFSTKYSWQKIQLDFAKIGKDIEPYSREILTICFLLIIQTIRKWIFLMPIKYRSRFLISLL